MSTLKIQSHVICLKLKYRFPTHAMRRSSNMHLPTIFSIWSGTRFMIYATRKIELRRLNSRFFSSRYLHRYSSQTNEVVINKMIRSDWTVWSSLDLGQIAHYRQKLLQICRQTTPKLGRNGYITNLHKSLGLFWIGEATSQYWEEDWPCLIWTQVYQMLVWSVPQTPISRS